eukprot:gb/GEZN01017592.1/.p1 GENE.gb/GEZN01017592.1/~~gb/GEZN01017592.1/.p1  ORF type:complete len:127 (-),score=15.18 gb/GEZN01017592.1/:184-564(-)
MTRLSAFSSLSYLTGNHRSCWHGKCKFQEVFDQGDNCLTQGCQTPTLTVDITDAGQDCVPPPTPIAYYPPGTEKKNDCLKEATCPVSDVWTSQCKDGFQSASCVSGQQIKKFSFPGHPPIKFKPLN